MTRRLLAALLLALVATAALGAVAQASRSPTAGERRAVVKAAFSPTYPVRCVFARISTRGPYAGTANVYNQPTRANRKWCEERGYVFDGGALLKRTNGKWKLVTAGSDIGKAECAKLPQIVLRDLSRIASALGCSLARAS